MARNGSSLPGRSTSVARQAHGLECINKHLSKSIIMGNIEGLMPRKKRFKTTMIKELAIEIN